MTLLTPETFKMIEQLLLSVITPELKVVVGSAWIISYAQSLTAFTPA